MRVLTIGTVMIDILAVNLPAIAEPGKVIYPPQGVETLIGGHPIDVAIDLVRLGISPMSVAVAAAVGVGIYGEYATHIIRDYGIQMFLEQIETCDTGNNIVLEISGEDRRFHIAPGANWFLSTKHVCKAIDTWNPDIVSIRPGYSGIDLDIAPILALSKGKGALVLLDIMQPHPDRPPRFLDSAYRFADIIHCNEKEALINTGADNIEDALAVFFKCGVKAVFVTHGSAGVRLATKRHDIWQPPFHVDAIDATGCGDAFCAGIIYILMKQQKPLHMFECAIPSPSKFDSLSQLLLVGQAVGATAATATGCVEGVSKKKMDILLKSQGGALLQNTRIVVKK